MFQAYAMEAPVTEARKVSLFRNGRNKALRIPVEFEPEGDEVTIRKEGNLLIIEPVVNAPRMTLAELLDSWEPEPDFPVDLDDSNLPPDTRLFDLE